MAKRRADPYQAGARSAGWVTVTHRQTTTCVVGGWQVSRGRIEALLLGVPDGPGLRYLGRVDTGLGTDAIQRAIELRLVPAVAPPFRDPLPRVDAAGARWCAPALVVEVGHTGERPDGRLGGIVSRGVRDDVSPDRAGGA